MVMVDEKSTDLDLVYVGLKDPKIAISNKNTFVVLPSTCPT